MANPTPRLCEDITNGTSPDASTYVCEPALAPACAVTDQHERTEKSSSPQPSVRESESPHVDRVSELFNDLDAMIDSHRWEYPTRLATLLSAFAGIGRHGSPSQQSPGSSGGSRVAARLREVAALFSALEAQHGLEGGQEDEPMDDYYDGDLLPSSGQAELGATGSCQSVAAPTGGNASDSESDGPRTPGDSDAEDTAADMADVRELSIHPSQLPRDELL
ncbi:hypothetical protein AURDEDRAFT_168521 [Auricularia subglabra TFB-10046 SS5]|nr:hypothetical protein AURDEDRAFT_168521 [Auricularia subglabra TFB-10046 SS5]